MIQWYTNETYMLTRNGAYSMSTSYNVLLGRQVKFKEAELVWNSIMMPRHRFIVWLAYHDRLLTKARLHRLNMPNEDDKCGLCEANNPETQQPW